MWYVLVRQLERLRNDAMVLSFSCRLVLAGQHKLASSVSIEVSSPGVIFNALKPSDEFTPIVATITWVTQYHDSSIHHYLLVPWHQQQSAKLQWLLQQAVLKSPNLQIAHLPDYGPCNVVNTGPKPLWYVVGHGEVVPARTSPTLHPPSPPTVHQLSWLAL